MKWRALFDQHRATILVWVVIVVVPLALIGGAVFWATREPDVSVYVVSASGGLPSDVRSWLDSTVRAVREEETRTINVIKRDKQWLEERRKDLADADAANLFTGPEERAKQVCYIERIESEIRSEEGRLEQFRRAFSDEGKLTPFEASSAEKWFAHDYERIQVTLQNNTDAPIPGARLVLEGARSVWRVQLVADFLSAKEEGAWAEQFAANEGRKAGIVPLLPTIPPNRSIDVVAYGDVDDAKVSVAATTKAEFEVVTETRLRDEGLFWLISRVGKLSSWWNLWVVPFLGLIAAAGRWLLKSHNQVVRSDAMPDHGYSFAIWLTQLGHGEAAVELLRYCVTKGRSKQSVRDDLEFRTLWGLGSFQDEFGEPTRTPASTGPAQ